MRRQSVLFVSTLLSTSLVLAHAKPASVRRAEATADADGTTIRVVVTADGEWPRQTLSSVSITIGNDTIEVPPEAFRGFQSVSPAALDIRKDSGIVNKVMPKDALLPLRSVGIDGVQKDAGVVFVLDGTHLAYSIVQHGEGNFEYRCFDARYREAVCGGRDVRRSKAGLPRK